MMNFQERAEYGLKCGIYGIKNIKTDKIYIGQTRQPFYKRYQLHDWQLRNNKHENQHLQNSYNKYGEKAFEFIIIEAVNGWTNEILNELEIKYIAYYKSINHSFNILDGGGGRSGHPMSEEAKRIIGLKNKQHMLGRKLSEETKEKIRKSSRHLKMSEENKQKLIHINTGRKNTEISKQKMRISHLGSKNKNSVLNESQVLEIKKMLMSGIYTQMEISQKYNVNRKTIENIVNGRTWKQVYVKGYDIFIANRKKKTRTLTDEQVILIRKDLENGISQTNISKKYNIKLCVVNAIKTGRTYKNVI